MGLTIYHKLTKYLFVVILVLLPITQVYGGWTGPVEVVVGSWGNNVGQFGFESGDTADIYPNQFGVDKDGNILVADLVNRRVQIFKTDGSVYETINKPTEINVTMWPRSLVVFSGGNSFLGNLYVFNYAGDIVYKVNIAKTERYGFTGGYIIKNLDNNTYFLYSPTGQLLRTSTTRPSELGVVSENALAENQYKITITYPDKTYYLTSDATFMKYVRDTTGNVYGVNDGGVWRFNQCGKEVAELLMPVNQTETITSKTSGRTFPLPVEYGQPVVASNGDVYTWKKSRLKYRIVKWTWQDDSTVPSGPDAPTGLTVTPSTTGLYLAWTASAQDPGCVTGYEVARATSSGGVFSTVGTVDKGVVKYNDTTASSGTTYYYKVRAKAGSEYSQYTSEASGRR